jgi:hypothetical protein
MIFDFYSFSRSCKRTESGRMKTMEFGKAKASILEFAVGRRGENRNYL